MAREVNAAITYSDAIYMVANENFSAKQSMPSSNQCMIRSEIEKYLLYQSDISDYATNELVPYHRLSPHFWQFISAYYRLENTTGSIIDLKGGKNADALSGTIRGIAGKIGNAFDVRTGGFVIGNNAFFDFAENGASHPTSFVCWVKYLGAGTFSIFTNALSETRWSFRFETIGNDLVVRVKGGSDETVNTNYIGRKKTNFDFKINQWQLLGFRYSGGSGSSALQIYQNGNRIDNADMNSGSFGNAINTTTSVKFFYKQDGIGGETIFFNGYADETLFLKKYAMTVDDFKYLYNNGAGRILAPPTI